MHLGNGIICPMTAVPMLAVAGAAAFFAYKKAIADFSKEKFLMVATLTALVFALQMINFTIPMTGSSGHIIGGILLAALIGPFAAFLAMCAILIVQAVFFADGGLLALGCNIFNMGILACFVAYPFIYKPFEQKEKPVLGSVLASVAALQLGSAAIILEVLLSGTMTAAEITKFAVLMPAVHLPIGLVEGSVTAGIIALAKSVDKKKVSAAFLFVSILLAGVVANYASVKPDGLEWSLLKATDGAIENVQETI